MYNDYKVKLLHIMLPKTSTYVKRYDGQTKWMYFLIEDNDFLNNYNTVCDKVSAGIEKEFDRKPVYNKKNFENKKLQIFVIKKFLERILIILV